MLNSAILIKNYVIMNCFRVFSFFMQYVILLIVLVTEVENFECKSNIRNSFGVITSPGYPDISIPNINCTWYITGQPNDIITIQFADVNLKDNTPNCRDSWVELGPASDKQSKRYCGSNMMPPSFVSSKYKVWITYHISQNAAIPGSGVRLIYSVQPRKSSSCRKDQFHCQSGKCIPKQWTCNGRFECEDGSDEVSCRKTCSGNKLHCQNVKHCYNQLTEQCNGVWNCPNGTDELGCGPCKSNEFKCSSSNRCYDRNKRCDNINNCMDHSDELGCSPCRWNEARCSISGHGCYNPRVDKCNGKFECIRGEDEVGCKLSCPNKIHCLTGKGCYAPKQRCNSISNCADSSDEKNCTKEVCRKEIGGFLCSNKMCIRESWICDQTNDCGDYSDEEGCVRNSVITAAVMGALICGLLLVVAVGCTCKLYTLRMVEQHDLNYETPMSQIEREFMQRQPPPPYAIAVGGLPFFGQDEYSDHYRISLPYRPGRARSSRRMRRHHSRRRRAPSPPPLDALPPPPPPTHPSSVNQSASTSTLTDQCSDVVTTSSVVNITCDDDSNKEYKPVESALFLLHSPNVETPADKSDSGSEASLECPTFENNQIQLGTFSRQTSSDGEDSTTDDTQPICAS